MDLSANQRQEFCQALINAFPSNPDLEKMVSFKLNQSLEEIVKESKLEDIIFLIIKWAEAQGKLEDLIRGAYEQNPGNPKLKAFRQKKFSMQNLTPAQRAREFQEWVSQLPPSGVSLSDEAVSRDSIYEE